MARTRPCPAAGLWALIGALLVACAPSAAPTSTAAPSKPAATTPVARPVEQPTAAPTRPAAKPTEKPAAKAPARPSTPAELALYTGPERQQLLEEGARKEGKLLWYTSLIIENYARPMADAFRQKYPYVNVEIVRLDGDELATRVTEEASARRFQADFFEASYPATSTMSKRGLLLPFNSAHTAQIPKELYAENKTFIADREGPLGLAINTQLIPEGIAPRTFDDLLRPELKGKLSTQTSSQATQYIGAMVQLKGEEFVRKLAQQEVTAHNQSANAVLNLIAAGEVAASLPVSIANTQTLEKRGAPVRWIGLEPVPTAAGYAGVFKDAPHPHAALLLLDFIISEDGQKQYAKTNVGPTRQGIASPYGDIKPFQRFWIDRALPDDQYEAAYKQWERLHKTLFVARQP